MKKLLLLFLFLIFISCEFKIQDVYYNIPMDTLSEMCLECADNKFYCIEFFIFRYIKYKKEIIDKWQTPSETFEKREGDCEDKAILFLWIIYQETGIKGTLRIYHSLNCNHATAYYENYDYEYDYQRICDFYYIEYDFDYAMYLAEYIR